MNYNGPQRVVLGSREYYPSRFTEEQKSEFLDKHPKRSVWWTDESATGLIDESVMGMDLEDDTDLTDESVKDTDLEDVTDDSVTEEE